MRKIILTSQVTLDGFMAGPNGELDWGIADEETHLDAAEVLDRAGTLIYGRATYQTMVDYWPAAEQDPSATEYMKTFARAINPKEKVVYSKTLQDVGWNTRLAREVIPDEVRAMKAQPGKDMLLAGAVLASTFLKEGLVDEILVWVQPVVLGKGKRLFKEETPETRLKLLETRTFESGVVVLHYKVSV